MTFTSIEKTRPVASAVNRIEEVVEHLNELAGGSAKDRQRYGDLTGWSVRGTGKYTDRYLIGFTRRTRPSGSIVQMATPVAGYNRRLTGLMATDDGGRRWLMHKGILHVSRSEWTPASQVQDTSGQEPVSVMFSDGKERSYYAVANLDQQVPAVALAVNRYVEICERIREPYDEAEEDAPLDEGDGVDDGEADPNVLDQLEDPDAGDSRRHHPGPPPSTRFGNPRPTVDQSRLPADCYVFRYADSQTWKIGWALDAEKRIRRVRTHIPLHLAPDTWRLHDKVRFPTASQAYDVEQRVLTKVLAEFNPEREQVTCAPEQIEAVIAMMREVAASSPQKRTRSSAKKPV